METVKTPQQRRIPAVKRWSRRDRITARRLNEPIDAINQLVVGVAPARQVSFVGRGRGLGDIDVTGPWACFRDPGWPGGQLLVEIDALTMAPKPGRILRAPGVNAIGAGGDAETIWYMDPSRRRLWKLDAKGRSVLAQTWVPGGTAPGEGEGRGIGGTSTVGWCTSYQYNGRGQIYRIDAEHLIIPDSFPVPYDGDAQPAGIGGNENVVWYTDFRRRYIHRIDPNLDPPRSVTEWRPPDYLSRTPRSVGGNENVVYYCSVDLGGAQAGSTLYRLDPNNDMRVLAQYTYPRMLITGVGG